MLLNTPTAQQRKKAMAITPYETIFGHKEWMEKYSENEKCIIRQIDHFVVQCTKNQNIRGDNFSFFCSPVHYRFAYELVLNAKSIFRDSVLTIKLEVKTEGVDGESCFHLVHVLNTRRLRTLTFRSSIVFPRLPKEPVLP